MSEQKGIGSKILGIFVEPENSEAKESEAASDRELSAAETVAELARKGGAGKPPIAVQNLKLDMTGSASGAATDFHAIFLKAGMDAGELDRVKKAEDLLRDLPPGTPQAVKKQIVEASLRAFGFEVEKIVQAAQNQKRALDAFAKVNESSTAKANQESEQQIRALNEKIVGLRAEIEKRAAVLASVSSAAQARKTDVQKVIDFFTAPGSGPTRD